MDPEVDEAIINSICSYAETKQIKPMLQEYLKRIIIEKPVDPLKFLLKTIEDDPYTVQPKKE